ncbi:hypothetical protein KBC04_01820 [Candidatus Babeliales bacterium]|nr:hypothetical protein [Candidatus Babeliales bacterium]MBP9843543.1 hypothetical protein [Candidatus Babeliales bacterium]
MKHVSLFFCIFLSLIFFNNIFAKSLTDAEQALLAQRQQDIQQSLDQILGIKKPDYNPNNADLAMGFIMQTKPDQQSYQQHFELTTVHPELAGKTDTAVMQTLQPIFEDKNKFQQDSLPQIDQPEGNSDQLHNYIKLATALIYYGYKGYKFFKKDISHCRLQADVLDIPYKKMVYVYTQAIDKLFEGAQQKEDICQQIKSLILLCRMPVPKWYKKSFQKGLEVMYNSCFDDQGNFTSVGNFEDIKLVFKAYCRKAPTCWQDIAKISDWWCKHKTPEAVATKYETNTLTEHNQQLLNMIEADKLTDLMYLKNIAVKNGSPVAQKIYEHHFQTFLQDNVDEFGIWKRANLDPWWKDRSWQEKQIAAGNNQLNEILMMRDQRVQQLVAWLLRRYDNNVSEPLKIKDPVILDALYQAFAADEFIFENHDDQNVLRKILISCITYLVEHKDSFQNSLIFTSNGILKKYEFHPSVFKHDAIYDGDLQTYINCALALQSDFFDAQTKSLAVYLADYAKRAQTCDDEIEAIVNQQCAVQIFKVLSH